MTALLFAVAWSVGSAAAVHADLTVTDLQIAARALSFTETPPSGTLRVGILYSSSAGSAIGQAESAREMLAGGLRVGNVRLEPVMVDISDAARADVDLLFLPEHMAEHGATVRRIARAKQLLCVTTDIERVRDGSCPLGVRSSPKVEILVNRASAMDSGTAFATAFRVMITEL